MSTILNNIVPNHKVECRIIKDGFSSPILGYPNYIGKKVILNASTAKRFMQEGIVELWDNDQADQKKEPSQSASDDGLGGEDESKLSLDDALEKLNHDDDAHWTKSGMPDLNVLKEFTGRAVKRSEVPEDFTRNDVENKD